MIAESAAFFLGALGVEREKAREHLIACRLGPAVAPWLAGPAAGFGLVILPFKLEIAGRANVGPAVGVEHGPVHYVVQPPQFADRVRPLLGIVEAVEGVRETFVP